MIEGYDVRLTRNGKRFAGTAGRGGRCQCKAGGGIAGDAGDGVVCWYTCAGNSLTYIRRGDASPPKAVTVVLKAVTVPVAETKDRPVTFTGYTA